MNIVHSRRLYIGTSAERASTIPPVDMKGVVFYDTDLDGEYYWDGSAWHAFGTGSGGGDVYGDPSVTDGHMAVFDVDGYHIKDGGAPGGGSIGYQTLTDGATISWNLSSGSAEVTLEGNRTLNNPTNLSAGVHYFLVVIQDGTGNRTLDYGNVYKFPGHTFPTLSTYLGFADILTFDCDGTYMIFTGITKNVTNVDPVLTYVTNQLMWLKSDVGTYSDNGTTPCIDTDPIYYWEDQSGNANHAIQATATNRPTFRTDILNGKPAIEFNGTDNQFVVTAMNGGDNVSFFIVIIPADTSPVGLIDTTAGTTPPIRNDPAGTWDWYYESPATVIGLTNMNPVILEFVHSQSSGRTVKYYKNGNLISTNTNATETATAWGDPRIGSNNDGSEGWYNGKIMEFLIYSESISDLHGLDVITYLKARWGIS
jgi:hypothetical protein